MESNKKKYVMEGSPMTTVFFRKGKRATVVPAWLVKENEKAVRHYLLVEDETIFKTMNEAFAAARAYLRRK